MFQKIKYLLLLIGGYCMAQGGLLNSSAVIYNNASSIWIANNGSGHYTSNGTGRITPVGAAVIYVYGNWVNNASNTGFTADAGTVYMDGTNVNIGGTSPTTFYNLTLRNGGVKTMTQNIAVGGMSSLTGVLDLQDCELNLNQYTLTITNPNMTIGRTTGYINSENGCGTCNVWSSAVTWSNVPQNVLITIPFGLNGTYIPVTFTKTNAVTSNITVSTRSAVADNSSIPTNVTHMNVPAMSITQSNDGNNTVIDRWWYITPSTSSTSPVSLDLNFTYRGTENTCTGCSSQSGPFGAQYWVNYSATNYGWKPCAGPSWTCSTMGTWPGVTAGTQGATAPTGAVNLPDGNLQTSYWVLSCTANPLPIELVSFNALCQKNATALLQWKTASEVNALKFEIQKSTNGTDFISIASINAQYPLGGNYSYVDNTKTTGIAYYRLKMIDKDGSFKNSGIVDVNFDKCNNVRTQVYGYDKNIVINIQTENNQNMRAVVFDVLGRILTDKLLEVHTGANTFQLPVEVTQSIYFVKLIDERGEIIQIQKVLLGE